MSAAELARVLMAIATTDPSAEGHTGPDTPEIAARYAHRNSLVWQALDQALTDGLAAGVDRDPSDPHPVVVYIELPRAGQVAWHLPDDGRDRGHPTYGLPWDGHSTAQKYNRIALFVLDHSAGPYPPEPPVPPVRVSWHRDGDDTYRVAITCPATPVVCVPLSGYPGAYRVAAGDAEPYGDREAIITRVAEGWAVMWGRTSHGFFQHHTVLPGSADRGRAARAAVDIVEAVAAGGTVAAGGQVPVAHIERYAGQLRADAAAAEDALAVGLLRAADGLDDLLAATTTTGGDFTTAGPPHPVAAARAQAAAEQLPTVGNWPG